MHADVPPDQHTHADVPPDHHTHADAPPDQHTHADVPSGQHTRSDVPPDQCTHRGTHTSVLVPLACTVCFSFGLLCFIITSINQL